MPEADGRPQAVPVVSARYVRAGGTRVAVPVPDSHEGCQEPTVELTRDDQGVRAIDIVCPCGRRLRILCDYEEGPAP